MNGGHGRDNGKGVNHIRTFSGVTLSSAPSDPTPRSPVLLLRNPAPRHIISDTSLNIFANLIIQIYWRLFNFVERDGNRLSSASAPSRVFSVS